MDDLYGNAWGDPLNDYSNQPYTLPTWNTQPPSPKQSPPVEDDQDDNHENDDANEDLSTGTQLRADSSDASWTADAVPWPVEGSHDPYHSAWTPVSPVDVWSSAAQPQTPVVPTQTPPDDISSNDLPLTSPILPEEPKEEHLVPSEQARGTPIQSRVSSPDQFGTFESGDTDATIPVEEVGWGSPKCSTLDDAMDPSNAWGQQVAGKKIGTETKPMDEWEVARRTKERLDRRVVCVYPHPCGLDNSLSLGFSLRKLLRAPLTPLKNSLRACGQKVHRAVQILKRSGFRAGDTVLTASKACT